MEGKAETVQTSHLLRRSDTGIHRLSPQFLESRSNPSSMLLHLLIIAFIRSADNESPTAPSQLLLLVSFLCHHEQLVVMSVISSINLAYYIITYRFFRIDHQHNKSAFVFPLFFGLIFSSLSHWFFEIGFNSFFLFSFLQTRWKCRGCWSWSKEIQFPTAVHKSAASAASTTSLLWSRVALTFTHVSNTNNLYNAVAAYKKSSSTLWVRSDLRQRSPASSTIISSCVVTRIYVDDNISIITSDQSSKKIQVSLMQLAPFMTPESQKNKSVFCKSFFHVYTKSSTESRGLKVLEI
jgi:hypothetical protein